MKSEQLQDITAILLKIFTPGPLNSPIKFSWRVLTSWMVTGWVVGLLATFLSVSTTGNSRGMTDPGMVFAVILFVFPIVIIVYGLIGLGIDLMRGKKLSRTGWVWYIYPILSIFWIVIGILGIIIGLAGLSVPKEPTRKMTYRQLLDLISKMPSLEFVSDFGNPIIDSLLNENKLNSAGRTAIQNAKELAVSQPRQLLGNSLSPDDLNQLAATIGINTLEKIHGIEVVNIPANVL
jgi:hypothetical protein